MAGSWSGNPRPPPRHHGCAELPEAATMVCRYRFTLANGMPPREDRIDVMFTGDDGGRRSQMKHHGNRPDFSHGRGRCPSCCSFPSLTGRPR